MISNNDYEVMWVEKYRPKTLDEIVNQKSVVERLKGFVKKGSLPHLLFSGPPGTGKTSAILALANEIFGPELAQYNVLELNASDERGIKTVREDIKEFARTAPVGGASFKIIILDEADNLTSDAQQALRRTMERYVKTSRFALLCNYPSKIIEPIQSRCAIFRFSPLSKEDVVKKLKQICNSEKLTISDDVLEEIYYIAEGDLRKAINLLQAVSATGKDNITKEVVYDIAGLLHPNEIREIIKMALKGDLTKARRKLFSLMVDKGISGTDIIKQMGNEVMQLEDIPDNKIVKIMDAIAETDYRLTEGASEDIQILALLAKIAE